MTVLIIIGIYLIGYVLAYLLLKYTEGQTEIWQFVKPINYTIRDRVHNLKCSILSWFVILLYLVVLFYEIIPKPKFKRGWWQQYLNKPAKW